MAPVIRVAAPASRAVLGRAVRFLAGEGGIRQFLDTGTGLPSGCTGWLSTCALGMHDDQADDHHGRHRDLATDAWPVTASWARGTVLEVAAGPALETAVGLASTRLAQTPMGARRATWQRRTDHGHLGEQGPPGG